MVRILFLCMTAIMLAPPASAAEPLKLVANYWGPYTENGAVDKGQASQLVTKLLADAGYDATIEILPWRRALIRTYNGQADGIVAIWSTVERRNKVVFSEPYLYNRISLLHRKGVLANAKSFSDLDGLNIGVGLGYDYCQAFMAATNFHRDPAVNTLTNLKKLLAGRVDAILEDEVIVNYYRGKYRAELPGADNLEFSAVPLMVLPLHFGISRQRRDAEEIIERFNAALRNWQAQQKMTTVQNHQHLHHLCQ